MCDFSLHHVKSRPAKVGDKLLPRSPRKRSCDSMTDSSSCARSSPARPRLGLFVRSLSIRRSAAEGRSRLAFAPYGREPRLLVARKSRRAVVVFDLEEPGSSNVIAPGVEIEEAAIAAIAKAFLVVSFWV
jgi:hypothetical protein